MSATQLSSQVTAGTNTTVGPDGAVSSASISSAALDAILGPMVGGIAYRGQTGWTLLAPGTVGYVLQTNGIGIAPSWVNTTSASSSLDGISSTQGAVLYRGVSTWAALAPGTAGQAFTTGGPGQNPSWTSFLTAVNSGVMDAAFGTGFGVLARDNTGWNTRTPPVATTMLRSDGTSITWQTFTNFLDAALGSTQGSVIYRAGTIWTLLGPGTSGQVLTTNGASANPSWTTVAGSGTVTNVGLSLPAELTVSNSPVTTTGTLTAVWASQTTNKVLAAPNGSTGVPSFRTLAAADIPSISSLLDGISTTQGAVLYRGASAWSSIGPGTSGQYLQTQGAGANPQWAALSVGGFPSGTAMLFQQTSAPTGWTKQTTHNDKLLRVVSGTASSGGSNAFSTINAQTVVGSTTLSVSQIPSHNHNVQTWIGGTDSGSSADVREGVNDGIASAASTGFAGGGGSHNHTISMNIQYVDLIIATAN